MVLYFSGTGNSKYVAKRLVEKDEQLVNIADILDKKEVVCDKGRCIFVFPVYFYTVPEIIVKFVSQLDLINADYIGAVITCGGGIMQAGNVFKKLLAQRGYSLSFVCPVLMPDNSMLFYQIDGNAKEKEVLMISDQIIAHIIEDLKKRKVMTISDKTMISDIVGIGYTMCNKTKKFYALDNCIHCGLCAKNCPEKVIELVDGKPKWIKDRCCKCSSCINRCPVEAIQYGKATLNRHRYVNSEEKNNA